MRKAPECGAVSRSLLPIDAADGSRSPEHPMLDASRALAEVLPGVRVEWLAGQGHGAMRASAERWWRG